MAEYRQPQVVPTPDISIETDPNTLKAGDMNFRTATARVSAGNPNAPVVNTQTRVKRGTGAATKGNKYSVNSQ